MVTTAELTEDAYNSAVEAAVDLLRVKRPELDLRTGTAIRSLVIEPGAMLDAQMRDVVNRLRTAMSLRAMSRETTVPREDAEAVLSNFGITLGGGTKATGKVRVNLIGTTPVTLRSGVVFTTEEGMEYVVTEMTTGSVDPADGESKIVSANDGTYYFTVPVEAVEVGAAGNIRQGHAMSSSVIITNFLSAEAFSDFSGGEDGESVASAVARIPSALAYRGMTNSLSVRGQLAASVADPSVLRAVSCVGYRDRAQLRDKHNVLGIAVGGRVDVYVRLFDAPGVVSFMADGVLDPVRSSGDTKVYRVAIPSFPGFYAVKYVGPASEPNRQGSLQYELVRETVAGASDAHDFMVTDNDNCETAWSAYQGGHLIVYDNVTGPDHPVALSGTQQFKVDLFWTDGIAGLQELVDDPAVRNVAADYVVRTPAVCLVSMSCSVRMKPGVSATSAELEKHVADYVNGRSFVRRITRSELANVLLQHGAESVDLSSGGMLLGGRICGADGRWYYLSGDSLDVSEVGNERAMLTAGTVVFAAEPGAIQITIVS